MRRVPSGPLPSSHNSTSVNQNEQFFGILKIVAIREHKRCLFFGQMAWNVHLLQSRIDQELVDILVQHLTQRLVVSLILVRIVADVELKRSIGDQTRFVFHLA